MKAAADDAEGELDEDVFVCSTCGRTDLPPAGDWDPPICSECDAAINFGALVEAESFGDS
jgi:hypothetical protein